VSDLESEEGPGGPAEVELRAFLEELEALERELRADLGQADLEHMKRLERIGRACTALGWATSWMGPNLFSAALIAQGRTTRWATVAHHVSHQGLARVPGVPERYTRKGFAKGRRRWLDWLDVIQPHAWHTEHNMMHHARLGEAGADPDLVEANLDWLRESELPLAARYALVGLMACVWKWSYYAPNTLQEAFAADARRRGEDYQRRKLSDPGVWDPRTPEGRALWLGSYLPYALVHFALGPALFLPLGPGAAASAAANSALAEILTNLHTFLIITTNHAGDDVAAFEGPPEDRAAFLLRQIVGSVNYRTGGDLNDLLHGWLNYQIEHHVWPDMSPLQYRKAQPKLKALCQRHGIPYVQQSVWTRLRKTLAVMVGEEDMKRDGGWR
jgi:fatty acid desaturase